MTIGTRIRIRREEINMTQPELAKMANLSQGYVSELENGKYNPTAPTLLRLAKALRMSVSELIGEERRAG